MSTLATRPKLGRKVGEAKAADRRFLGSIPPLRRVPGTPFTIAHFDRWCREFLVQSVDQWAGLPLEFEGWQKRWFAEALARPDGTPTWHSAVLVVPRKNGKSTMLGAFALYSLLVGEGAPEILLAAASDKQAGRMFETIVSYVRMNPELAEHVHLREYIGEVSRIDAPGKILRMASDPSTLHGYNPSLVICDEVAFWTKPGHRRAWAALTTAGGARQLTQVVTITTAGTAEDRDTSILGRLLDGNERNGELEQRPGLTISRNPESRIVVWNYSAPTLDPHDIDAMKLANPASWISEEYLARQAANDELAPQEVLQLHGCVWTEGLRSWIPDEAWQRCFDPEMEIPAEANICVGVDVGSKHDSSAVVIAHVLEDGRVALDAHVWEPQMGAKNRVVDIEKYLRELSAKYAVDAITYDERFFNRSAEILAEEGLAMVELAQNSSQMADAYQGFYQAVMEGRVVHRGGILTQHVRSATADMTDRGWKVRKSRQSQKIDACVAAVMALFQAENPIGEVLAAWA